MGSKTSKIARFLAFFVICAASWHAAVAESPAQAASSPMVLLHAALTPDQLPAPGKEFKVVFSVQGSRDLSMHVKALAVRDGRLMELQPVKSYLSENDNAAYEFSFYAPLAEISYQFIVYLGDESVFSKRFSIRRSCVPEVDLAPVQNDPEMQITPEEKMLLELKQAKSLEKDLNNYEQALGLLREVKAELNK